MTVPQLLQEAEKFAASHRAYAKELAPAYADFHDSVASLLERLAAALAESERQRVEWEDATGENCRLAGRLEHERDTLCAQREALVEALRPFAERSADLEPRDKNTLVPTSLIYAARDMIARGEK